MPTAVATYTPALDRAPVMRHNQILDFEQLRQEAVQALEASGKKQVEIARELGKSEGAISRALKETGATFAELQMQMIEHLTGYRIEREERFRALRKEG